METLVNAFVALNDVELDNLVWHVENKTSILCGRDSSWYTNYLGHG